MKTATCATRFIGIVTLGWVYFACTDLRWLLHLHALRIRLPRTVFSFSYYPYLACNIANVAVSIAAVCLLLAFPSWLLGRLTPRARAARPLTAASFAAGIVIGLVLLVLGSYTILSNILWTVYRSGHNSGWQTDLAISVLVAAAGIFLCRRVLAGRALT